MKNDRDLQNIKAGVSMLLKGEPFIYEDIEFLKTNERALSICSYCECDPEQASPDMARERIKRAKSVLADLSEKNQEFKEVALNLSHEHYFLSCYGKGSFVLAKENRFGANKLER